VANKKTADKRRGQTRVEKVLAKMHPKDSRWWREDEKTCHEVLFGQLDRLRRLNGSRRRQDVYFACLYDDAEFATLVRGTQAIGEFTPQTLTTNIVKRQIDAFVARHTKNRPVPMALSNGGTYSEQRRAKSLSKVFDGLLDQVGYWDARPLLRRDGAVFGSGFALNHRIGGKLFHDRAYPWEFLVDPREAMYGCPQTIVLLRYIDRLVMMERHPKLADLILDAEAGQMQDAWNIGWDETCDLVLVAEAWHLPSAEPSDNDAKGGAHAICVSNATLELREYRRDYFPITKWDFYPPLLGWRGEGMAKQLAGLQYEVNAIGLRLQEQGYMAGTFVWTPPDVGFEPEMIDNGVFTHIESAVKPEFFNPSPWHPQIFEYYMQLRGRFPAEESRLSEMSTRGELPPGLESGRAIRSWNQLDDQAFLPQSRSDESVTIDTAWQFYDLLEEIHEEGLSDGEERSEPSYVVSIEKREHGQTLLEDADWSKVRLDKEKFKLKVFPTSLLTGTPAEQIEQADDLAKRGLLSLDEVYALVDIPDVQRVLNLRGAPRRAIEKILEKILDAEDPADVYMQPEPAMNLELCRALALMTYLDAFTNDAPEINLRYVLQFAIDAELELEAQEDAGAPAPPGVDPMAEQGPGQGPALPHDAGAPPGQFAPPDQPPLPANAMPPAAIAPVPGSPGM
jgi:hypothetical protein